MGYLQPERLRSKQRLLQVGTLLLAATITGCNISKPRLPVVLYMAVSLEDDRQVTTENSRSFRQRFTRLGKEYRALHPDVQIQMALYDESQLVQQLRERNQSGLGPDLILTSGELANALLQEGLVDPLPLNTSATDNSSPNLLNRLRNNQGKVSGQPLVIFPQLACFDRRRLKDPPGNLQALLSAGASGHSIGLSLKLRHLIWTAGALGAIPGLRSAAAGQPTSNQEEAAILSWLTWLQNANNQRSINFYPDQADLRDGLIAGQLDWVTCNSSELQRLRATMGPNLGVSALPNGPEHEASPLNRLRVLALGSNSSPKQRQQALALSEFAIKPLWQRMITMENLSMLPANPHVTVPVKSSQVLAAMQEAREQGANSESLLNQLESNDPRVKKLENLLIPLVFGASTPEDTAPKAIQALRRGQ